MSESNVMDDDQSQLTLILFNMLRQLRELDELGDLCYSAAHERPSEMK